MIDPQNCILSFYYKWSRLVGSLLIPLNQDMDTFGHNNESIEITMNANRNMVISLREQCTLA